MDRQWVTISAYGRIYGLSRSKVYEFLACQLLRSWQIAGVRRVLNRPPDDPAHQNCVVGAVVSSSTNVHGCG